MQLLLGTLALSGGLALSSAVIIEQEVHYLIDGEPYDGFIAHDLEWLLDPRPAVMVVHQWQGLGSTERMHARELAERGMVRPSRYFPQPAGTPMFAAQCGCNRM